ncbi:hypothetical protein ANN_13885 [Periplaneta americana]|uniref:Uncharacterized protein n=1 Tax=Periplaneta americana TaxID=6978 RepID=A0ABQ8SW02_PERAM|nr:hypothetical protein ANN_13885 [Periplaneta americana]
MAGLCEGGNEPPGSLKASCTLRVVCLSRTSTQALGIQLYMHTQPTTNRTNLSSLVIMHSERETATERERERLELGTLSMRNVSLEKLGMLNMRIVLKLEIGT